MKPCKHGHTEGRNAGGDCLVCSRESMRRRRAVDPERFRLRARAYNAKTRDARNAKLRRQHAENREANHLRRKGNILVEMLYSAKQRAKKQNVPFDLKPDDLVMPNFCPVLGIPLAPGNGRGAFPNSPSLDKIIPELGYVRGNVAIISHKANAMKHNGTPEELMAVANWVRAQYPPWLLIGQKPCL